MTPSGPNNQSFLLRIAHSNIDIEELPLFRIFE